MIQTWETEIYKSIEKLKTQNSINKGAILTEGDLECFFYSLLSNSPIFSKNEATITDSWNSPYMHSQITWFENDRQSKFRVDLTILNPANLDINQLNKIEEYPHKGFFHDGPVIGIELKFIRSTEPSKIKSQSIEDYKKVIEKIIPAKKANIENGSYSNLNDKEFSLFVIILFKTENAYNLGQKRLSDYIKKNPCPNNVHPVIIYDSTLEYLNPQKKLSERIQSNRNKTKT